METILKRKIAIYARYADVSRPAWVDRIFDLQDMINKLNRTNISKYYGFSRRIPKAALFLKKQQVRLLANNIKNLGTDNLKWGIVTVTDDSNCVMGLSITGNFEEI